MNEPVFLKIGLNYPKRKTARYQVCDHAWLLAIALSVALNFYLLFQLKQSWKNERALSESVNQLTPKWP